MLQYVLIVLAFAPSALPRSVVTGPDPRPGPTPVTDKDVLAWSSMPVCADRRAEQRAIEQRMKGLPEECMVKPKRRERD
jgi:hypothetical protein